VYDNALKTPIGRGGEFQS